VLPPLILWNVRRSVENHPDPLKRHEASSDQ